MNKIEKIDDLDLLDLVIEEVKDTVVEYGFNADTPLIKGSALLSLENNASAEDTKCIKELISAMDTWFDGGNSKSITQEEIENLYAGCLFYNGVTYIEESDEDNDHIEEGLELIQKAAEAGCEEGQEFLEQLESSGVTSELISNFAEFGKKVVSGTLEAAVPIIISAATDALSSFLSKKIK